MICLRNTVLIGSLLLLSCVASKHLSDPGKEAGVSRALAVYRKQAISNIHYHLDFNIPKERKQSILAKELLRFDLSANAYPLQIDFKELPDKISHLEVNQTEIPVIYEYEHLIIGKKYLKAGRNDVKIEFVAGDGALNRNADYLYTLFVPDRARTVFPCFDQPDLKATYSLELSLPENWQAIANAPLKDSVALGKGRKRLSFETSDTLSTYLFAFAAGKFTIVTGNLAQKQAEFLYRETDTSKINRSVKDIFALHSSALNFLEEWTAIPYPFKKFGFVAIPDFQFGGMEHPGAIQYKASALFLDGGATKDQLNARTNVIAHETAHMWFGDLVTMNWFSDVWMKEVFANFMADKSTEGSGGKEAFDLKFLVDHFPAAYSIDRTSGSNPIRQKLDNLKEAGTLYGNIIYHKAPIVMRQLERLMGKDEFQRGVREYLQEFANGNASWPDLIGILDKYSNVDLEGWNQVWVNDVGRPVLDYHMESRDGKITEFSVSQKAELGQQRLWPQMFELKFFYVGRTEELTLNMKDSKMNVDEALGMEKPLYIEFNSNGQGYGLWPVDRAMFPYLYDIESPLDRASAYINLYENMLSGRTIVPTELLELLIKGLKKEKEELNLKLITGYISTIYWEFTLPEVRKNLSSQLEHSLWEAMLEQKLPNNKKLLFKGYQDIFSTAEASKKMYLIWDSQKAPDSLSLNEDDYTSMAFALALRGEGGAAMLAKQLTRINNLDRKKRFEFIMPAVSADSAARNAFFKRLEKRSEREKESNVGAALYYLHHPLRQSTSVGYLDKSLEMLEEIQSTGDIFFPQNWLQATFGNYQSKEAANIVRQFLDRHPNYNLKLKAKILQAADNLFKAEHLLSP